MVETWSYGSGKKIHGVAKMVENVRQRPKKIDKNGCFLKFLIGYSTVTRFLPFGSVDLWIQCFGVRLKGLTVC